MAQSTCIKCGYTQFELTESKDLNNATLKCHLVQCAKCGGVVGVSDILILKRLDRIEKALRLS